MISPSCAEAQPSRYALSRRRVLFDMQIPDWDPAFLRRFDPQVLIAGAQRARADALMLYFQSHTGLCNWPTRSGRVHAAFRERDVMAELLGFAHDAQLPVCAYYSVNFNNAVWLNQPDWRLQPASPAMIGGGLLQKERYGLVCLNHPEYRAFVAAQTREILERYPADAMFFDMVWWMGICECGQCRVRLARETGAAWPVRVDWLDPEWCAFQAARERWLTELAHELRATARQCRPEIAVYHNFAVGLANWTRGVSFASAAAHDFLGGDFYGGGDEQGVVSRLMNGLSESRPVEFMTTVTANLSEHERLKPVASLQSQALAAVAEGASFLGIIPVDPDGSINDAAVDRLGAAFDAVEPYIAEAGGIPVEQIGVYFSGDSKMSFADNGLALAQAPVDHAMSYPHLRAVQGACRVLRDAHMPWGVITRKQLAQLHRFRLVVLPNVLRMDAEEVAAIREYVRAGGRIYASRWTSLTSTAGERHGDFALADVFGCHFKEVESGRCLYLSPRDERCRQSLQGERHLAHWLDAHELTGAVRISAAPESETLMSLTLPFGYPSRGSVEGQDWASIHSHPPWQRTDLPGLVRNRFGAGTAVYSAADLESGQTDSHDRLLLSVLADLAGQPLAFSSDAPARVNVTVFDQPARLRWVICVHDAGRESGRSKPDPFDITLTLDSPRRFTTLHDLPGGAVRSSSSLRPEQMRLRIDSLDHFAMFAASYSSDTRQ